MTANAFPIRIDSLFYREASLAYHTGAHEHRNWANENFRKVALNAILWIAKVPVPANGVECVVTPDDLMANLDPKGQKPKATALAPKAEPFISPVLPEKK